MAEPLAGRLRRAEAALRESFAGPETEWRERRRRIRLDLLREHVTTGYDRLKTRHADGASGAESVRAYARFMDDLLRWLFDTADGEADQLRRDCDAYVDTTLGELEESLGNALQTVNRSRASMWRGPSRPVTGSGVALGRSGTGMDLID